MNRLPLVTVVVPARNEAEDIEECLAHIAAQDYPLNRIEVIVVDGASTDGTATIAAETLKRCGFESSDVVMNRAATTPSNLNAGLARARGEIVARVDARSRIERHHLRTCVEVLEERSDIAIVGGAQIARARDGRAVSIGIARALNNRWSMGFSRYRRATASGPSDTVYLGTFRTAQLRTVNGWDERLLSNQDYDLNQRMSAMATVWFEASLATAYLPRPHLAGLWSQYVRFGRAKAFYWRVTGEGPELRQWSLMIAPPVVLCAGLAVALVSQHLVPTLVCMGLCAAVGLLAVDEFGSRGSRPSVSSRVRAISAMMAIGFGWLWGVFGGLAHQGGRCRFETPSAH